MKIEPLYIQALISARYDELKSNSLFQDDLPGLRQEIESEIHSLSELAEADVYKKRYHFFKIDQTSPEDFRERIVMLDSERFLMAGIRFRGLNVNRPMIGIVANFNIHSPEDLQLISKKLKAEFALFRPQTFMFKMSAHLVPNPTLLADRFTVAGLLTEIVANKLADRSEKIELKALDHSNFYPVYLEEYQIFHQKNPSLIDEVKAESLEDFQEAMSNRLCFEIFINNERAGIIAGTKLAYYGQSGVCILEEILYDRYKGQGFGPYIQKAFAEQIAHDYKILWGTISHLNQPSLKTALKNSRRIEEIEYCSQLY